MMWTEFEKAIKDFGFTVIDEYRFNVKNTRETPIHIVAAHNDNKLLLVADSQFSAEERVRKAIVYGAFAFRDADEASKTMLDFGLNSHSVIAHGSPFLFDINVSSGYLSPLKDLGGSFPFVDWDHPWGDKIFPFFVDYGSMERLNLYGIAMANRLKHEQFVTYIAPQWVRDFTGWR